MHRRPNSAPYLPTLDTSHQIGRDRRLTDSPSDRDALAPTAGRPRCAISHLLSAVLFALVILTATLIRLGLALRPPPFLTPDSQGYYLPGWELAQGLGFGPELRRTPAYPLFIALAVLLFGEDLRGLMLAQHALGVLTAGLTFVLGWQAYGRLAGLLAGLGVALAGPLLIYEHYVLTEALFTPLLTLALLLALLALRHPSRGRLMAAGLSLAAATLTRPVADVLLPLLPLALLLRAHPRRQAPQQIAWYLVGLALLLLPWMTRNALAHGTFSAEGALGQALIGRTVRHDDPDRFYRCPPAGVPDDLQIAAVGVICDAIKQAGDEAPSGGGITEAFRTRLGLSQAQSSNLLRQVAVEAILGQPGYYLSGTIKKAGEILVGKRETVLAPWRERTTRNWDNKWDPRLMPLVAKVPPADGPEYERADALVSFFQPWRWRWPLALILTLGLLGALAQPTWRPALLLSTAAGLMILASAALDGNVWRYRYPVDPLLAVTIGGGAQLIWVLARSGIAQLLRARRVSPAEPGAIAIEERGVSGG
jgi:4-amino-4-deoxy-L-arabinose transferase-like glycosyltransferase